IMRGESLSVMLRTMGISLRNAGGPWRTAMPRSSRKARIWLITLVRWQTSRSRTRCSACRSSCSTVLMATNFMVGRNTASAIASASRKVVFRPFRISPPHRGRHHPPIGAVPLKLPPQVMPPNPRPHADEAGRRIREPSLDLAARKLLAQNDRAIPVETDEVERVLADVDADCCNGFKATGVVWHGMLLILYPRTSYAAGWGRGAAGGSP